MQKLPKYNRHRRTWHFWQAWLNGWRHRHLFAGLQTYVMFVGYPRSGHSLVGAQLTAHRNMMISHELHALNYLNLGYSRNQLLGLIHQQDQMFVRLDCQNGKYRYQVPNQWQGRYQQLTVVGDKKGAGSTQALIQKPELLDQLRRSMRLPVRLIHVVRNPFDTISRMHLRSGTALSRAIDRYFRMCRGTAAIIGNNPEDVFTVRHEDYVADPAGQLAEICRFIGVPVTPDYLSDSASVVYHAPRQARREIRWPSQLIGHVQHQMSQFDFLQEYQFGPAPDCRTAA